MSLFQTTLFLNKIARVNVVPLVKYSISSNIETFHFNSNFTEDEQAKILNTLNDANTNQLSRFNVSQNRIKSIESWKNKKGPFRSLGEVLEVDGLGEKMLHKMCEEIVNDKCDRISNDTTITKNNVKNKRYKNIVIPSVNGNIVNNITSAVGVHLSPMGISWAKLSRDENKVINWNFDSFSCLPKKMLPNETFEQSIDIVRKIPPGDVYVFEASQSMGPQAQATASAASSYSQQLELSSMLLALLNTSLNHNVTLQNISDDTPLQKSIENRVFYLKSRISARLFSTLVGQEKVAAITTINDLLQCNEESKKVALPCTPIAVDQQLKMAFQSHSPATKELLGQALMLVITFMDLCIYKNPVSLAAVYNNNSRKHKK